MFHRRVSTDVTPSAGDLNLTESATAVVQRMAAVREAFRLRRVANKHRSLWLFYLEHNLLEEANSSRVQMIEHLRCACQQWRLTLGTTR